MTPSHPLKSLRTIALARTQDLGRNPSPSSKEGCGPTERLVKPPQQLTTIANLLRQRVLLVFLLLWVEFCTYIRGFGGVGCRRIDYIIASRFEWMSRFHVTYVNGQFTEQVRGNVSPRSILILAKRESPDPH